MQLAGSFSTTVSATERPNLDGVSMPCLGRSPTRHTNTILDVHVEVQLFHLFPHRRPFWSQRSSFSYEEKGFNMQSLGSLKLIVFVFFVSVTACRGLAISYVTQNLKTSVFRWVHVFYWSRCIMSDIVFGGWSDTWRTDLGYASVRSPDIRPPPQTISYTKQLRMFVSALVFGAFIFHTVAFSNVRCMWDCAWWSYIHQRCLEILVFASCHEEFACNAVTQEEWKTRWVRVTWRSSDGEIPKRKTLV